MIIHLLRYTELIKGNNVTFCGANAKNWINGTSHLSETTCEDCRRELKRLDELRQDKYQEDGDDEDY
jgi:hypothetical protein